MNHPVVAAAGILRCLCLASYRAGSFDTRWRQTNVGGTVTRTTEDTRMSCSNAIAANSRPRSRATHLSPDAAFNLLASITVSFLASSAAPTPLYPLYQAEWGFSPIIVTVVFGIYALALLSALLVIGRLSDYI